MPISRTQVLITFPVYDNEDERDGVKRVSEEEQLLNEKCDDQQRVNEVLRFRESFRASE